MLLGAGAGIPIVLSGSAYYGWIKTTGPRRSSFAGYYEFAEFAVSHGYGAGMLMGHLSDDPTVQLFMFGVEVGVSFDGTVNFIHLL